ncbi:mitochondrial ACP precursor, putative [Plasmodium ovale wallikeri]|uniref:Mitochondrial ACP, putative n=2 Tax=Plasmodium ovale TaxID=36330 RepID=A0A1A8ZM14_PLAOA|nr:mitochondrial ACP precursor, putative [Plasmodium ovale wallikeri]SBT44898.1 mitochondrial ACP precursor, putative [Plasmodium ovale wallikeri]SBT78664.1 mitochondrial ACP precursor, putative [Plasmodium ovale]
MRRNIIQKIFGNNRNAKIFSVTKRGYFHNIPLTNELKYRCTSLYKNSHLIVKREGKINAFYFSTESDALNCYSTAQIEEKVLTVLKKYLPADVQINYNEELEKNKTKDDRAWDFLDTVEFLIDIESEFNITIPDETADNIKTVQEVIDYLVKLNIKKP